jgi:hypothetical protein
MLTKDFAKLFVNCLGGSHEKRWTLWWYLLLATGELVGVLKWTAVLVLMERWRGA